MADYIFADDYRLEEGPTREFFKTFLKGLVHKHNNTLGVIQGFSTLILYEDNLTESVRENAQEMNDSARESNGLNQTVLTAAGCSNVDANDTSLASMHPFLVEKANRVCEENGVTITGNDASSLPTFSGDSSKLSEVLMALIRNAAEGAAETASKTVSFEVYPPGEATPNGTIDLFIRNSCDEWTGENIRKHLEAFESTKSSDHYGLGLTTAAVLCGQMGIRMGLKNENGQTEIWLAVPAR